MLPHHFGGYRAIFHQAANHFADRHSGGIVLEPAEYSAYATLALGSALAAFMYPHTITSVLASGGTNVIRRNAVLLPAYTFLLGLVALLGIVGAAAGLHLHSSKDVVPALILIAFPKWFVGFAFAAITVAALVPAAIMSIAAANLFTRNLYREYLHPNASDNEQANVAKYASIAVNLGALLFVLFLPMSYAVNLQLLGGVLILQTFPAIVFGLWRRLFHHNALLLGWVAGIAYSAALIMHLKFQTSVYPVLLGSHTIPIYVGILALMLNLLVASLATVAMDWLGMPRLPDAITDEDFLD
jgi:SSS family solute:Na+ symporter